ncbi:nuclear transport factor 2 family protein [Massilia sp. METH4]|uniref:nuclear transport factor 2 family protein n=1 Tax=Massilia sp. METH4 TaxID=3123041 RepID=UPI0030D246DA
MIELPQLVAAYVAAANDGDAERVARCFIADATVRDEGTTRRGTAAIAAWAEEATSRYQATIVPAGLAGTDAGCRLTATVSGNFPGSPATLQFNFVLRPDGIAALEIGP